MFGPSKGGTNLAQSFMQNKATQPTQQLAEIKQPVAPSMPLPQQLRRPQQALMPVMGSMAPQLRDQGRVRLDDNHLWINGKIHQNFDDGSGEGMAVTNPTMRQDGMEQARRQAAAMGLALPGSPSAAAPQVYQPSQAQLMARAINERAGRGR